MSLFEPAVAVQQRMNDMVKDEYVVPEPVAVPLDVAVHSVEQQPNGSQANIGESINAVDDDYDIETGEPQVKILLIHNSTVFDCFRRLSYIFDFFRYTLRSSVKNIHRIGLYQLKVSLSQVYSV